MDHLKQFLTWARSALENLIHWACEMAIFVKHSGTWKTCNPYVKDGGVWKPVKEPLVYDEGVWKGGQRSGIAWHCVGGQLAYGFEQTVFSGYRPKTSLLEPIQKPNPPFPDPSVVDVGSITAGTVEGVRLGAAIFTMTSPPTVRLSIVSSDATPTGNLDVNVAGVDTTLVWEAAYSNPDYGLYEHMYTGALATYTSLDGVAFDAVLYT